MAKATIKVDKTNSTVTVTMPLEPALSKSGTMLLLTSTRGNQETEAIWEDETGNKQHVYANINIGVYATPKTK